MSAIDNALMDINVSEASEFLRRFGDSHTFQTFPEASSKEARHPEVASGSFSDHVESLIAANESGDGVFFVVNCTDGFGRKAENIIRVRALFVDLDGSPIEPVLACSWFRPHVAVESSPGRYHAYWFVNNVPMVAFRRCQRGFAKMFRGDSKVCDLPRVMRLPGFLHQKGAPFVSRVIHWNSHEAYEWVRVMKYKVFQAEVPRQEAKNTAYSGSAYVPKGAVAGHRNERVFKVACAVVRRGGGREEVEAEANAEAMACSPPLLAREVAAIVRSAMRYSGVGVIGGPGGGG